MTTINKSRRTVAYITAIYNFSLRNRLQTNLTSCLVETSVSVVPRFAETNKRVMTLGSTEAPSRYRQ